MLPADFVVCHTGVQPTDPDDQGCVRMFRLTPPPAGAEIRVFVRGQFPPVLPRIFDFCLHPSTIIRDVVYPTELGVCVTEDTQRWERYLGPGSTLTKAQREEEKYYFNHGDEIIKLWEASGRTYWPERPQLCTCAPDQDEYCSTVVLPNEHRVRIEATVRRFTLHRDQIFCEANELRELGFAHAELEQMLKENAVLMTGTKVALGFEGQLDENFRKMVAKKNERPTTTGLPFVAYFPHAEPDEKTLGECHVIRQAYAIPVETAYEIICASDIPVYLFGCPALRDPDTFAPSMLAWPAVHATLPKRTCASVQFIDAEPRTKPDASVTSDPSHLYTTPSAKRFVYTLKKERWDVIAFYVSPNTTPQHLAYAQAHARKTLVVVHPGKANLVRVKSFIT